MRQVTTPTGTARTTTTHRLKADFIQIHCPVLDNENPGQEGIYFSKEFRPIYRHHERGYRRTQHEAERNNPYMALTKSKSGGLMICMHAKVLGPGYPQLITGDNINHALEIVREVATYRGCDFDTDHIRRNGEVLQLHATEDVSITLSREDYRLMNNLVQQPATWIKRDEPNGIYWNHRPTSAGADNATLAVYNKGAQMANLKYNRTFMHENGIDPGTFEGKARFEARLRNMATLRKHLDLSTLGVNEVLTSGVNPVKALTERIFDLNPRNAAMQQLNLNDYLIVGFIETEGKSPNGIDWARVESIIRQFDKSNPSRRIRHYRQVYECYLSLTGGDTNGGRTGTGILLDATEQMDTRWCSPASVPEALTAPLPRYLF